jgi:hypothetical protein
LPVLLGKVLLRVMPAPWYAVAAPAISSAAVVVALVLAPA